jgi:alpha-tubulin suppressor-like RCC1 family protein
MVTSLKNLKNEVDSRLAGGGLTDLACCQLQNAETILDNNVVISVANIASLPDAELNEGRFVYVDDINEYRFSNQTWTDDPSSTICVYQNQLWGWGKTNCGQLGDGTLISKCSPIREICSATNWCQVSASRYHTAAVKTSGEIWAWGANTCGRLGDGTITNSCSPIREFCSATDWCQVSAGYSQSSAIKTSGELWGWGNRTGDGTTTNRCSPVREFCSATDWCQVCANHSDINTSAIKTSGELWSWGNNNCGNHGSGNTAESCSPVREFCSAIDWCQVSRGYRSTGGVKTSGQIWMWGGSNCGMLGDGTVTAKCSPIREICSATDWCYLSVGRFSSAAIKTSGELWSWGRGLNGELADGTTGNVCSPVREICSATDWCQVSAGSFLVAAIKTSGQLWAWGNGGCGGLGDGTVTTRCSPVREISSATDWCQVSTGDRSTIAIKSIVKGFLE